MADNDFTDTIQSLLRLVHDVARKSANGFIGDFKKDCTDLARRISLLSHLFEELMDFKGDIVGLDSLSDLTDALKAVNILIVSAGSFDHNVSHDGTTEEIVFQFQCVTCRLEKALANLPYDRFNISKEVKEQVDLVRCQLKRATKRYGGSQDLISFSCGFSSELLDQPIDINRHEDGMKVGSMMTNESDSNDGYDMIYQSLAGSSETSCLLKPIDKVHNVKEKKNVGFPIAIPVDFLCPISLELIRDPVIVSTGQTYERSYIQKWINSGNTTCPKTQQKLQNLVLTPNYVLKSLITQWCINHNVDHTTLLTNRRLKKTDGTYLDVSKDIDLIEAVVDNLSSHSMEERRTAASEIRSLSKESTDKRILIAEAGAIPILVDLLASEDTITQHQAVTSLLNLSIYENNIELIMLANAVPSIVQVFKSGKTMETRENAAATLFSLSLADENKIIIGASGAIPLLIDLLENGSRRGQIDAATALFSLCMYQGNKGKAVRAGIIAVLLKMLTDSSGLMVDEALTILSILACHHEAKAAMTRACIIPYLIHHMESGISRNKENAISILLSLCKRDDENLGLLNRPAEMTLLIELANNGTERTKRKANLLLMHLQRFQERLKQFDQLHYGT